MAWERDDLHAVFSESTRQWAMIYNPGDAVLMAYT